MAISKILHMKDTGQNNPHQHLYNAITYILNPAKTGGGKNVGSLNCQPDFAYSQMVETKQEFGKLDERQGYHLVISLPKGEGDIETAMAVTHDFVGRYLGAYESVYAVHDDKEHLHSHIIWNSVSFDDGLKYHYKKGNWKEHIQPIVNELCEKYNLSTLTLESGEEKEVMQSRKQSMLAEMVAKDIDDAVAGVSSWEEFLQNLRKLGYSIRDGKVTSVKGKGMERAMRLTEKNFGKERSREALMERIAAGADISAAESGTGHKPEEISDVIRIKGKSDNSDNKVLSGQSRHISSCARMKKIGRVAAYYRVVMVQTRKNGRRPYSKAWRYRKNIEMFTELQKQYAYAASLSLSSVEDFDSQKLRLEGEKKSLQMEKKRLYQKKRQIKPLSDMVSRMERLDDAAKCYMNGNSFFKDEYVEWSRLAEQVAESGYTPADIKLLAGEIKSGLREVLSGMKKNQAENRVLQAVGRGMSKKGYYLERTEMVKNNEKVRRKKEKENEKGRIL